MKARPILVAAACVAAAALVGQSRADERSSVAASLTPWLSQTTATGNWGGRRDRLADQGVTLSSSYTADVAGNVSGGREKGSAYAGFAQAGAALDFGKIAGLNGLSAAVSGFWSSGRSLSADAIDNLYPVQESFAPAHGYLGQLSLSQSLCDQTLTLQAGRLFAADVFATSPLWDYYLSGGINSNLNSIPVDVFLPASPTAAWGARGFYQPTKDLGLIVGIYDADPHVAEPSKSGTDFSFRSAGVLALTQMTYEHDQASYDAGLPGSVSVGGYYESNQFTELDDPMARSHGAYGFYLYVDQMLYRGAWSEYEGPAHLRGGTSHAERQKHPYVKKAAAAKDRSQGLSVWSGVFVAPQPSIAAQVVQAAGGLLYHGLLSGRERDVTAVGVISGTFSDRLAGQGTETVLEANHRFQLASWVYLTPDFQYVIHPNGVRNIGNAAVFVGELSIDF
jgi:porin